MDRLEITDTSVLLDLTGPNTAGAKAWLARVANRGSSNELDAGEFLAFVREGIAIRRTFDAYPDADDSVRALRREVQRSLYGLQRASYLTLSSKKRFTGEHDAATATIAAILTSEKQWLSNVLADPAIPVASRTGLLDAFVDDFGWLSGIVASLEGQTLGDGSGRARVRLTEIGEWLGAGPGNTPTDQQRELQARQLTIERTLLDRRITAEIDRPIASTSPNQLWSQRFHLSRMRLDLQSLLHNRLTVESPQSASALAWIGKVDQRRDELADTAERAFRNQGYKERAEALEHVTVTSRGEANEISTQIEDVGLSEAVRILQVARSDFRRLEQTASSILPTFTGNELEWTFARRQLGRLRATSQQIRDELQDKRLAYRLESIFGRTFVAWLERTVLALVLVLAILLAVEWTCDLTVGLEAWQRTFFAWADLCICLVFLFEFFLKLYFVEGRLRYLRRRVLVDFFASIPFGFLTHQFTPITSPAAELPELLRLLRVLRLPSLARYLRIAQPAIRIARLFLFAMRITDGLVRQYANVFNRNIILFEPITQENAASRCDDGLGALSALFRRARETGPVNLSEKERLILAQRGLEDLEFQIETIDSMVGPESTFAEMDAREIPVEDVVERLIEMTPEEILETMGLPFAESVRRWTRLFNVPLVRRLPLIRELLEHREKGAAEVAALTANYAGHAIQSGLNVVYFFADLQATISPPIFLDRIGATLILATARPAKRLLIFGAALLLLSIFVWPIPYLNPLVTWIDQRLVRPIFIVGLLCLVPLFLGTWLRRVANQAAEFCDRVVEAQFAAQTKQIKRAHETMDLRFLAERVIDPELQLRQSDEATAAKNAVATGGSRIDFWSTQQISEEEGLFLQTMKLFYQDYLDGSMLHHSDTKTTTQLLGNLALSNFRLSNLSQGAASQKRLQALDLSRSAGKLLGGPYLWFNFITRAITQQTARLLIDYNRNAIPLPRLTCATREERETYREWLARRLNVSRNDVTLPAPIGRFGDRPAITCGDRDPRAAEFFHTVDFMAIDFLTANPERDELIRNKYGPQILELLRRDRQENVRKAFRSYPLHDVPSAVRTVNPLTLYETYCADGRFLVLPFRLVWWTARLTLQSLFHFQRVLKELLRPNLLEEPIDGGGDNYEVARRKIHRMRKPVFMESLWLRARFDVEYAGLAIPHVPLPTPTQRLLDVDLDFIGANRRERITADRLRQDHRLRLHWIDRWLTELGWDFRSLKTFLENDFPFLGSRRAEVMRAMVTAALLDHDDIYTLASSLEGMRRVFAYVADPRSDFNRLPEGLPETVHVKRRLWYRSKAPGKRVRDLFLLPGLPKATSVEQKRIVSYLRKHRAVTRGWSRVLLSQGGADPVETLRSRWLDVIARTGVWSDQFIALRTIQTLTMLDVYHYCDLVWKLGDFERVVDERFGHELPWSIQAVSPTAVV